MATTVAGWIVGTLVALLALAAMGLTACGTSSEGSTDQAATPTVTEEASPPAPAPVEQPPPAALPEPAGGAGRRTQEAVEVADGTRIEFTLILPDGFEAGASHPTLLAFPPGGQGQAEVDFALDAYWETEARARGWVVVSPVAPAGALFFQESAPLVPEFLATIAAAYPPEGGKFHVAGVSNGGLSSFRAALDHTELFHSLLVLPGFPPNEEDFGALDRLAGVLPVTLYVGENDGDWREAAERADRELRELGGEISLTVSSGEGHILQKITNAEYFDVLDAAR